MLVRICTLLVAAFLILNVEGGTWLSFNQKTGGLGDDFASQPLVPVADLARLVRSCDEELTNSGTVMSSQQRRTADMCKTLIDMISRK